MSCLPSSFPMIGFSGLVGCSGSKNWIYSIVYKKKIYDNFENIHFSISSFFLSIKLNINKKEIFFFKLNEILI